MSVDCGGVLTLQGNSGKVPPMSTWNAVAKGLPAKKTLVLIKVPKKRPGIAFPVMVAYLRPWENGTWFWENGYTRVELIEVSHWAELPAVVDTEPWL